MSIFYWIIFLFLVLYEPVYGYFDYQKFKRKVQKDSKERIKYYKKVMLGLWLPTIAILMVTALGPLTFQEIGLKGISINMETLGPLVTYTAFGLVGIYCIGLIYYLVGAKVSQKMRTEIARVKKEEFDKSAFKDIMPVSKEDKRLWTYVSWTAGITEEVIYRGFLLIALTQMFPSHSLWLTIILSGVMFGLAHTYQGFVNVIKTSLFGLVFSILYIGLGSIVPLIILHFLIDYVGKIGDDKD
ncbi:CPBP family intramembrane glutamic endopeptidase [Robertmurraya korlensis]|uniref:CPBP family intramembrane glutamic endopeptidase n=1 Tax=Robertmurraya korlensis TaxID=519977 RepID=UPI0008263EBC|nr:CPBP family intramembrane glutamic endopeptidase [Robertmurraya korlensis]